MTRQLILTERTGKDRRDKSSPGDLESRVQRKEEEQEADYMYTCSHTGTVKILREREGEAEEGKKGKTTKGRNRWNK